MRLDDRVLVASLSSSPDIPTYCLGRLASKIITRIPLHEVPCQVLVFFEGCCC